MSFPGRDQEANIDRNTSREGFEETMSDSNSEELDEPVLDEEDLEDNDLADEDLDDIEWEDAEEDDDETASRGSSGDEERDITA